MCEYCDHESDHHGLCPMSFIRADTNRQLAHGMGVPVSTSDWIDAWALRMKVTLEPGERDSLVELFSRYHRWCERKETAPLKAEIASLIAQASATPKPVKRKSG